MRESVGNRVYEFRDKAGVTQQELADAADVTRQTIIAIEKGNYIPSLLLAFKISRYFKQSIEKIFYYEK
ncbi:MAG: helix-turn-helix transcriptional regulator [Patescibacteria group bacterium]